MLNNVLYAAAAGTCRHLQAGPGSHWCPLLQPNSSSFLLKYPVTFFREVGQEISVHTGQKAEKENLRIKIASAAKFLQFSSHLQSPCAKRKDSANKFCHIKTACDHSRRQVPPGFLPKDTGHFLSFCQASEICVHSRMPKTCDDSCSHIPPVFFNTERYKSVQSTFWWKIPFRNRSFTQRKAESWLRKSSSHAIRELILVFCPMWSHKTHKSPLLNPKKICVYIFMFTSVAIFLHEVKLHKVRKSLLFP